MLKFDSVFMKLCVCDEISKSVVISNNSVTLFGHCPLVLGPISIGSVLFQIKSEGKSFNPGLVVIGLNMENSLQIAIVTTGSCEST